MYIKNYMSQVGNIMIKIILKIIEHMLYVR